MEYIEELITRIVNPMTLEALNNKYIELYYSSKKIPVDRASSFDIFKALIQNFSEEVVEVDEKTRTELG